MKDKEQVRRVVNLLFGIALLPPSQAKIGLKVKTSICLTCHNMLTNLFCLSFKCVEDYARDSDFDLLIISPLKKLFDYVKKFWLERVGATRFSVFLENHRTNNVVESWHRSLNRKMVGKHLNIWKFIGNLTIIKWPD